jgi:hypothetical protein
MNNFLHNILDENIGIINNSKMCLIQDDEMCQSFAGVSVSIVKRDKTARIEGNPFIQHPNRQINEEENGVSLFKLENNDDIQLSRRKSVDMENICIINDTPKLIERIRGRHKIQEVKNGSPIPRLRLKVPIITQRPSVNDPSPSIINNTIYLDNPYATNQISDTLNLHKMNHLSSNRIERIQTANKQLKKSNQIIHMEPVTEEMPKDKTNNRYNAIRIGHVPRENPPKSQTNI